MSANLGDTEAAVRRTPEVECCRCGAVVKVTEPHYCAATGKNYPPIGEGRL